MEISIYEDIVRFVRAAPVPRQSITVGAEHSARAVLSGTASSGDTGTPIARLAPN